MVGKFAPRDFQAAFLFRLPRRNVLGPAIFVVRVGRSFRMVCCIFQAFDRGGFERLVGIG